MKIIFFTFILMLGLNSASVQAWDGFDYQNGTYVEVEGGNLVREGETIEVFDYSKGKYLDVEVQSVEENFGDVELEVYDYESGEHRTFEMEE